VAHAKQQQQQQTSFYSPEHNNNGNGNNNHSKNASLQQQQRTLGGSASSILSTNNNSNATRPPVYDNNNELYDDMIDLTKVREAIRKAIEDDMEKRGDGTSLYGTFLFLSWICAATYDDHAYAYYHHSCPFNAGKQKKKKNINSQLLLLPAVGGTHGAPARLRLLDAEKSAYFNNNSNSSSSSNVQYYQYRATSGAWKVARDALEPVKAKFPKLSYADLYAYAGVVAVEESGGPRIAFRLGRVDNDYCNINGDLNSAPSSPLHQQQQYQLSPQQQPSLVERLPEADKGSHVAMIRHIRQVFYRMGFNDQEVRVVSSFQKRTSERHSLSNAWFPFSYILYPHAAYY
jgi:Peroxidase